MTSHTMARPLFIERIEQMLPGEREVYHFGSLMYDRIVGHDFLNANATACAAWDLMEAGKVHLSQRPAGVDKMGRRQFEYIAIKRATPYKPMEWWGCYASQAKKYTKAKLVEPVHRKPDFQPNGRFEMSARAPAHQSA